MDLNGTWEDLNNDSDIDNDEYWGHVKPEIWVARLYPLEEENLTRQAIMLRDYFKKAKDYITGNLTGENKAVMFVDEVGQVCTPKYWEMYNQSFLYVEIIDDGLYGLNLTTNATNFINVLTTRQYKFLDVESHGAPWGIGFWDTVLPKPGHSQGSVYTEDLQSLPRKPLLVRLSACYTGRFTDPKCFARDLVFNNEVENNVLVAIASANVVDGAGFSMPLLNHTLNKNFLIGTSFIHDLQYTYKYDWNGNLFRLLYLGNVIIGDGILKF